jgi:dTDP-4-dehydrorhamnose reductase
MLRLGRERESLAIVDDQLGAPTSSIELADATHTVVNGVLAGQFGAASNWAGLYHMTCSGSVSWCGFARAIFTRAQALLGGKMPALNPIPSSEYPTPAERPQNSVLSNEKLHACFGVHLTPWQSALNEVLRRLAMAR